MGMKNAAGIFPAAFVRSMNYFLKFMGIQFFVYQEAVNGFQFKF